MTDHGAMTVVGLGRARRVSQWVRMLAVVLPAAAALVPCVAGAVAIDLPFADSGEQVNTIRLTYDGLDQLVKVFLAKPARNPAMWSPGEAGVSTALVSGEVMLGVPGRSLAFVMERTYRSGVAGFGPLGSAGWSSRLFAHLREIRTTGEVEYHDGRGHIWRFYPKSGASGGDDDVEGFRYAVPDGYDDDDDSLASYYAPAGVYLELEKRGASGWRPIGRHNDIAVFNSQGRLIELRDRHRQAKDADEQGSTH